VGKTATAVNLAYLAARAGTPALLSDLDPQSSASFYFRIRGRKGFGAGKLLKGGRHVQQNIRETDYHDLDLLPSKLSFRNLDLHLDDLSRSKKRLKDIFQPLAEQYEYLFIDCPPGITLLSENVFRAADLILVPVIPTTLSVRTFEQLQDFFAKKGLKASRLRAFFSMVERRKKLHREVMDELAGRWPKHCFRNSIPYRSDIEKMGIHREPVMRFAPASSSAKAYHHLWREVLEVLG
jgi:cellulose biosynthesis protein BcsQ